MEELDAYYRSKSLWLDGLSQSLAPRACLPGDRDFDVAIVGAGFTGLWTAYYLKLHAPQLRVAVVEREIAGFGPAGRNGGWVLGGMSGKAEIYARHTDAATISRGLWATYQSGYDLERVIRKERIDCGFARAGAVWVATTPAQEHRLRAAVAEMRKQGHSYDDVHLVERGSADLVQIPGLRVACVDRRTARVNPGQLVRGLAEACEQRGVHIFERTEALEISPRSVRCSTGLIQATHVVRATEAFTVQLPHERRAVLPLYSLMIATEPLPAHVWHELRWPPALLVHDRRHLFFYAQRTMDDRLAIGGRGAPYPLGNPINDSSERNATVQHRLRMAIRHHFPPVHEARITHTWGGPLAVPRDWCMSISYDRATGVGHAGGYGGNGVSNAHLAGQTMADLILRRDTDRISLPWVGHVSPRWEPEPLRFLASQAIVRVLGSADRYEETSGRSARRTALLSPFLPPSN